MEIVELQTLEGNVDEPLLHGRPLIDFGPSKQLAGHPLGSIIESLNECDDVDRFLRVSLPRLIGELERNDALEELEIQQCELPCQVVWRHVQDVQSPRPPRFSTTPATSTTVLDTD